MRKRDREKAGGKIIDLMEALKASLKQSQPAAKPEPSTSAERSSNTPSPSDLVIPQ